MNKIILLIFLVAFTNPAEALFWKLSNEQEQICRKWAARENNQFSAKKTYNHCKNNIKREEKINARNEKIFERCMGNSQEKHDIAISKAKKLLKQKYEIDKFTKLLEKEHAKKNPNIRQIHIYEDYLDGLEEELLED